jgi:hypothetical protein
MKFDVGACKMRRNISNFGHNRTATNGHSTRRHTRVCAPQPDRIIIFFIIWTMRL